MRFRDLPGVYFRLGGRLAGHFARCVEPVVPGAVADVAKAAATFLPGSMRAGLEESPDRRVPVILVPGFLGPAVLLLPLVAFLKAHGFEAEILHTFPALGGVEAIARRIARAVESTRERTGASQVDLVAHSMGGLACRYYMAHLMPAGEIRRFVSIATPHLGTRWASFRVTRSVHDMKPGSDMLMALSELAPVGDVKCFTIRAGWDQIVWPREHGRWETHAPDHELPWAEHWAVQADPRTLALVLALLEAAEGEPSDQMAAEASAGGSGASQAP